MKEIGKYLEQARVKNGVSLEEASEDMNMSIVQLENIEDGNVRAFKDVFLLREYVKDYAKYLGLDVEQLSDEFNDFMFEKTSKISLNSIKRKKREEKMGVDKDQIASPYTQIPVKKTIPIKSMIGMIVGVIVILLLIFIGIRISSKKAPVTSELLGNGCDICECTY